MLTEDYKIFINKIKHSSPGEHIHIKSLIPKYIKVEINITKDLKHLRKRNETIVDRCAYLDGLEFNCNA